MLPDSLLALSNELAEAYARSQTCYVVAQVAEDEGERANHKARAEYWGTQVSDLYAKLTKALNSAIPPTVYATPDQVAPVGTPNPYEVEVRGSLDGGRAVSIRCTPPQAATMGAAMIACAAAIISQTGGRLVDILPTIPPPPPDPASQPA